MELRKWPDGDEIRAIMMQARKERKRAIAALLGGSPRSEHVALAVLCSLHAFIMLTVAAVIFLPIVGPAAAAVMGILAALALTFAWRLSRGYHADRRRLDAGAAQPPRAGDAEIAEARR